MDLYKKRINWLKVLLSLVTTALLAMSYLFLFNGKTNDLITGVLSDLIAVLIAVPILFLVFTLWGISPQEELKEEILTGLSTFKDKKSGFEGEKETNKRFDFEGKLPRAKEIDLISLSSVNFLTRQRPQITEAIKNGCKVRLLMVEPNSPAAELVMTHQSQKELEPDLDKVIGRINQILDDLKVEKNTGNISVRGVNWIPSCSILIFNRNDIDGEIRIKVYPLVIDVPLQLIKTHTIVYRRYEPELFDYYVKHFNILWERGKIIDA